MDDAASSLWRHSCTVCALSTDLYCMPLNSDLYCMHFKYRSLRKDAVKKMPTLAAVGSRPLPERASRPSPINYSPLAQLTSSCAISLRGLVKPARLSTTTRHTMSFPADPKHALVQIVCELAHVGVHTRPSDYHDSLGGQISCRGAFRYQICSIVWCKRRTSSPKSEHIGSYSCASSCSRTHSHRTLAA